MATDFSYKTEYAKSGRASCRACKGPIDKGELRLAAMVQSRHHDGKDPLWHHVLCFFSKRKLALAVNEIGGFGDLRWEDQEALKAKCKALGGGDGGGGDATDSKANGTKPAPAGEFSLLYTRSGSSKCPICKEKIGKGALAVSRKHGSKEKLHHLPCFADKREGVNFPATMEGKKLPGFDALEAADQNEVRKRLPAKEKAKKTESKEEVQGKHKAEASTSGASNGSGNGREEIIKRHQKQLYKNRDRLNDLTRDQVKLLLTDNGQDAIVDKQAQTGLEALYLRLADIMTFGALERCKKCGGQYVFKSGSGYECDGYFSEFAKCKDFTTEPARKPFVVPSWAKELDAVFDSETGKNNFTSLYPQKRCFEIIKPPSVSPSVAVASGSRKKKAKMMEDPREGNNDCRVKETVTMKMKGGAIVDPDSGMEDYTHVYKEGKAYYNAIMNRIDVENGQNSYYKLQLLEEDKKKVYHVFRAWGRIGTTIGGQLIDDCGGDLEEAKEKFCFHYAEKSGTEFGKPYKRVPGTYVPMTIDYQEESKIKKKTPKPADSKLPNPVQELISLIFDVEKMQDALIQFQINLDEMPLGKISGKQIKAAFTVLGDAQKLLHGEEPPQKQQLVDVTNRFFTYIPHSFGTAVPPLLDNLEFIKKKTEMLESLMEIELAYEILQADADKEGSPIDAHYAALKTEIEVMKQDAEEFGVIKTYLENTHAATHDNYDLEIKEVFKVVRMGETERFEKFKELHNRKLLWHGSRTTNFAGILSQGLRIAPPEAPATGYMFGKGIYFADMVSKSANYCFPSEDGDTGLLLLCEVALGDMHELVNAKESLKKAPKEKHSVKGVGQTQPDPKSKYLLPNNVEVPYGKPQKYLGKQTSLLYNEYIVYDVAQVTIRYLVEVEFKFKSKRRRP